ncbi:hypothetical protein [Variovorax sp. Root411]|uniref:hypothetical protein n=1 Tax=Variovorax sp. Root411 TaxID=1736530 RepID=UPI00138F00D1|nr:hypothetical protein [Variovorax sp. Root411]
MPKGNVSRIAWRNQRADFSANALPRGGHAALTRAGGTSGAGASGAARANAEAAARIATVAAAKSGSERHAGGNATDHCGAHSSDCGIGGATSASAAGRALDNLCSIARTGDLSKGRRSCQNSQSHGRGELENRHADPLKFDVYRNEVNSIANVPQQFPRLVQRETDAVVTFAQACFAVLRNAFDAPDVTTMARQARRCCLLLEIHTGSIAFLNEIKAFDVAEVLAIQSVPLRHCSCNG